MHWGVARTRAALALALVAAVAVALVSGGSPADPRTPPALPGMPPPFATAAVLGDGGLSAGIDAYGDVVDLRAAGPAGPALIDNPYERQAAGTVPADTGIVPRVSVGGGPALPLWRADSVRQRYLAGTNVLVTAARFGAVRVTTECAAIGHSLGCASRPQGADARTRWVLADDLPVSGGRPGDPTPAGVHLDDDAAARIVRRAAAADRRWLARARPLGAGAPAWARRMYARSLLVLRALTDRRSGAVAAGARDGWAYVWPRDAGAVGDRLRRGRLPRRGAARGALPARPRPRRRRALLRRRRAGRRAAGARATPPAGSRRPPGRPGSPRGPCRSTGATGPTTRRNPPATT